MTDRDPMTPDDEADALAAEFVLGVLPLSERVIAGARAKADPAFAARVMAWETRLAPMNDGFAPTPAPNVMPGIEARLFPKEAKPKRGLSWGFLGGALSAAVLGVVVMMSDSGPPQGPMLTATLTEAAQPLSFAARFDQDAKTLTLIRTAGAPPAAGQDLQLWVIGAEGTPRSLGLVRAAEITVSAPALAAGLILAVSLEPEGGSPTGLPTGPVLVTGVLTEG